MTLSPSGPTARRKKFSGVQSEHFIIGVMTTNRHCYFSAFNEVERLVYSAFAEGVSPLPTEQFIWVKLLPDFLATGGEEPRFSQAGVHGSGQQW